MELQQEATMQAGVATMVLMLVGASGAAGLQTKSGQDTAKTRRELEAWYQQNTAAYERWDFQTIMALRSPDFHSIAPDGKVQDRAAMENYIQGILNGVKKWNRLTFTLDSVRVAGDTAFAIVSQHVDRMALRPDNEVHHVQTWVTQREAWIRTGGKWLMWRVDQLRNQRRLVDGKPG
jgi:ketosteroid isomerase-like protein